MDIAKAVEEIRDIMSEDCGAWGIIDVVEADKVKGSKQEFNEGSVFDHEFVDQYCAGEDDYYGSCYFPIGEGKYLKVFFNF